MYDYKDLWINEDVGTSTWKIMTSDTISEGSLFYETETLVEAQQFLTDGGYTCIDEPTQHWQK